MRATLLCTILAGCGGPPPDAVAPVVRQYALDLDASYNETIAKLQVLDQAIGAFAAAPSASGQLAAQAAWLDAHAVYGEGEVSRFYGGPIDQTQGAMNEWPIDESFIDYTAGNPNGGIINDPTDYPQITAQVLAAADERGGIENLSTGFHALEFALWGQRPDQTGGPGARPYTDFADGGTAPNADRRRTFLVTVSAMLLQAMRALEADWHLDDPSSYAAKMVAGPSQQGLANLLRGFANMAIAELYYERLDNAWVTKDRKDEESCFSESTLADLSANARGVEDVYLGRYGQLSGPSPSDLVQAKDPALDQALRAQLATIRGAIDAIPPPFDHAVLSPAGTDANTKVQAAIDAFTPLRALLVEAGADLGVELNL